MVAEDRNDREGTTSPSQKDNSYFDDLARGLAESTISRRQAMKWLGVGLVSVTLGTLGFEEKAYALTKRQRRRCRNKGGIPLKEGNCHCAFTCGAAGHLFNCSTHAECLCQETIEGKGFCGARTICPTTTCTSSSQCSGRAKCVVNSC